ncbi:MAG: hypothetical protein SPE49_07730 [Campylobacter sp.]|uniref:hypothetical protein n=1 Tax=Campylobacter sp. TaxID=205 RepID=UPI002A7EB4F8|nr:hypothetical protein [Campylobacter sp.]MDY5115836.1 hypothetical protein [Campylobacter sp.]
MSFFCSQCGECCKNIRHIPELAGYSDENGCCKYLKTIFVLYMKIDRKFVE